ncbi:endo-1,4-beta-xylanase [Prevotella sp. tf2-5]|uniref:endo-1,4-beta-xylanase n=1 Tax=Prevotella sp. tf2-5 TaxID=1761889 RepID=UPI0008DED0A4|nr:endo-1,4-beta-xylanase [Prevotella sp. tf2-5]SFO90409.1 Carbohydrate binding domain-containing protein [Prevotella sp. tf2-5]
MKKIFVWMLATSLSLSMVAQEKFELGKPGNDDYRYLDGYKALKDYIDYSKYPNFKLGIGTIVDDYLNNSLVKNLTEKNFTETVAGNAMKMGSCVVDNNGTMNFTKVKSYVNTATNAGLNVYGHVIAWHSQQPIGWLQTLLADKPDPSGGDPVWATITNKDFRSDKTIGWTSDQSQYGFSTSFSTTEGLKIHCTKKNPNYWDVQIVAMDNIQVPAGKTCKMIITIKGSKTGTMNCKMAGSLNDGYSTDYCKAFNFTTSWIDVAVEFKPTSSNNIIILQCGDFIGDVFIKNIKIEGYKQKTIPLTQQERHDILVDVMDKWIKGMMEACDGKVKAWDLVNEAVAGEGDDGEGNYPLQHSNGYSGGAWDVGGDNFFWQDHLGDLDYVRQVCRLARKYGPEGVKLFINDYNLESDWDDNKKLKSLINWIKKWEADGITKIDGIGTQMHINYYENTTLQKSSEDHIVKMFELMANTGKLVRVSELDMGYVRGSNKWATPVSTNQMTEAEHKKMADFYQWIIEEYFRIIPPSQQWGICQWCPTDAPNHGWRANEPVGIWDINYYRKHVYAGFVRGLNGGDPTGINNIKMDKTTDTSKGIFNLNGVHMQGTSLHDLPSGLYIVNGKKIVK